MLSEKRKVARFITRVTPLQVIVLIACVYLFFITVHFVIAALSSGLNMDTYAANGTFQIYNPMRRLLAGQVIGQDFPFFHGVGIPLLHFPVFHLLGHNVFAADTAKWLISPLVFLVASFVFFLAFFRNFGRTIIATALLTIVSLLCIDVIWPGNSLLGIRTTLPVLIAAYILWRPRLEIHIKNYTVSFYHPIFFLLLGLAVACGTEQGLAAIVAYGIIEFVRALRSPSLKRWMYVALKALGAGAGVYAVISVLTLGHASSALHYALIDIPKDQGWYFGAPPNDFLAWNTLHYIFDSKVLIYLAPVICLGGVAFGVSIWRRLLNSRELYAFSFLALYGVVVFFASVTGYWAPSAQLVPLTRVFGLILIAVALRVGLRYIEQTPWKSKRRLWAKHRLAMGICSAIVIALSWYTIDTYHQIKKFPVLTILKESRVARHTPEGTYLSSFWHERVNAFASHIPPGATIWSTYTGIYDSMRHQLNGSPGGEDYIIHTLGPERREQYAKKFTAQKPDFVITLKPSYFKYEEWLWDRHWPFYQELVTHYEVIADNDSHILWKRQADKQPSKPGSSVALAPTTNGSYRIDPGTADHIRLYVVTVNYIIKKPIPLGDKVSRYLMEISGSSVQRFPAALPPYETSWQFPVILAPNDPSATIIPSTHGLGLKSSLNVSSVSYQEIPLDSTDGYMFYDNYCSFGGTLTYPDMGSQYHKLRCTKDHLNLSFFKSQIATSAFSRP